MSRNTLLVIGVLVLVLIGRVVWQNGFQKSEMSEVTTWQDYEKHQVIIGTKTLTVEVVNSQAAIEKGLGQRATLGADGMLFFLPEKRRWQFWMKDMQFPLDIIWIQDQQVVAIAAEVPAPTSATPESQIARVVAPKPIEMVLEIPAGKAKEWGIIVGSQLEFKE